MSKTKDIVSVLFDTTELYKDPFLQGAYNAFLLDLSKNQVFKLYLSNLVLEETLKKYNDNLTDKVNNFLESEDALRSSLRYWHRINYDEFNIETETNNLNLFYKELVRSNVLKMVPYTNVKIKEVVYRAINDKKPFSVKKQEFRDCLIWLSYASYVKKYNLPNPCLISNNVSDFYDSNKIDLHRDLKVDCPQLKIYKTTKDLFAKHPHLLEFYKEKELDLWISDHEGFSDDYVTNIFKTLLNHNVYSVLHKYLSSRNLNFPKENAYQNILNGLAIVSQEVVSTSYSIVGKYVVVGGILLVVANVEYANYDLPEMIFDYEGVTKNATMEFELTFSFNYDKDKRVSGFEVEQVFFKAS